ncbi:MAG TPA: exodeoxyribonuclease VII large subunit [Gammaproteobacteria bacterium]|nr:exodeoxyribonuclease VII large subunit [Gammaproteobacteria bacterium]
MIDISHTEEIYTVSRLNREARFILEGSFPLLWIEGEISGFKAHSSGHWYFCLKDNTAQVRSAMFRLQNRFLGFIPKDGMHVVIKARVSLYEGRGEYQLIAEHMEEMGEGKLRQEFERLKKRLAAAGFFDEAHKKTLPEFPESIGVITSPTGAAIKDILSVLKRRYAFAPVFIYPTLVQGETAPVNIVEAIQQANRRKECDILILARGGGSLEDLWCFNDERVAEAIFHSDLPIVSAIGHEIDFTIADFVADLRAATPTAAAELITPDRQDLLAMLNRYEKNFERLLKQKFSYFKQHLAWSKKHLLQQHPKRKLAEQTQRLDFFEMMLHSAIKKTLQEKKQTLAHFAAKLNILSPLATLERGFSITMRVKDHTILQNASDVSPGEKIYIQLRKGNLECTVDDNS